jgi:hypothetical protein
MLRCGNSKGSTKRPLQRFINIFPFSRNFLFIFTININRYSFYLIISGSILSSKNIKGIFHKKIEKTRCDSKAPNRPTKNLIFIIEKAPISFSVYTFQT